MSPSGRGSPHHPSGRAPGSTNACSGAGEQAPALFAEADALRRMLSPSPMSGRPARRQSNFEI
jgi:hypothetical protein